MEKLVSSWCDGKTLPKSYVFPPEKRPGEFVVVPSSNTLPIIDLGKTQGDDHAKIVHRIIEASHEFGFFQVINHGVERRVMDDVRSVFKEFYELPMEEKSRYCSGNYNDKCVLFTSTVEYGDEEIHLWRDALKHECHPLEECMQFWPDKPIRYRDVVGEYAIKLTALKSRILELISEGLGLETGYFKHGLSEKPVLTVNYYPPCPNPSLTLGTKQHCDANLITILLQGSVPGLQILKDGKWISVEPIPDAFVVNMGLAMQLVSNGKLRGVEHRAVTNADEARTTIISFVSPTKDCLLEPAKGLLNTDNPPLYRSAPYGEFLQHFLEKYARASHDNVLEAYMLKN